MENLSCPWSSWAPATLQWCERPLCEWIREPANAGSNIAYILIGLWIYFNSRKTQAPHLGLLGIFSILIGLMSAFYHASGTLIGEILDFSAMFMMSSYSACANLARFYGWHYSKLRLSSAILVTLSIGLLVLNNTIGIEIFAAGLVVTLFLELKLYRQNQTLQATDKTTSPIYYKPLILFIITFAIAHGIWRLDYHKIVCNPDLHWITGHAIWHILTAIGIGFVYKFYSQFKLNIESKK